MLTNQTDLFTDSFIATKALEFGALVPPFELIPSFSFSWNHGVFPIAGSH